MELQHPYHRLLVLIAIDLALEDTVTDDKLLRPGAVVSHLSDLFTCKFLDLSLKNIKSDRVDITMQCKEKKASSERIN